MGLGVRQCIKFLVVAWSSIAILAAEAAGAPIVLNPGQELKGSVIGKMVRTFDNSEHKFDFTEISRDQRLDAFKLSDSDFFRMGMSTGSLWLHFQIQNNGSETRDIVLENRYPNIDWLQLYSSSFKNGNLPLLNGDLVPFDMRSCEFRLPCFELAVPPGSHDYYLRIDTEGSMYLALHLWDREHFDRYERHDHLIMGVLFGFIMVMLAYNFFLAVSFLSRTYYIYVGYIICVLIYNVGGQGIGAEFLGDDIGIWLGNKGLLFFANLAMSFGLFFSLGFLNISAHMPRWKWAFQLWGAIFAVSAFGVFFLPYHTHLKFTNFSMSLGSIFLLTAGCVACIRGYRPAYFYVLAWSVLIASNFIVVLKIVGAVPLTFLTHWASLLGGSIEMILLSLALGDRVKFLKAKDEEKIRQLNDELRKHIDDVEAIVEERTDTIRSILNNVKAGFAIVSSDLKVKKDFTQSCYNLLGEDISPETYFSDWLQLTGLQKVNLDVMLEQVFSDIMPEEVTMAQIPSVHRVGDRYLRVEGALIRNSKGVPDGILMTITDITDLQAKEEETRRQQMLLKIIGNMESFNSFLKFTKQQLKTVDGNNPREVKGFLHTMKGNCLVFGMKAMADDIHGLEEQDLPKAETIEAFEKSLKAFLLRHQSTLHVDWNEIEEEHYIVKKTKFGQLEGLLNSLKLSAESKAKLFHWLRRAQVRQVGKILGPLKDDIDLLAQRIGKDIQFNIHGEGVEVISADNEQAIKYVIHLIRNAVIHGIEDERQDKPKTGTIDLRFFAENHCFIIEIEDDGKGIGHEELYNKLAAQSGISREQFESLTLVEVFKSLDSASTEDTVDLYSGRGVGVSAVIHYVESIGGEVEIETKPRVGAMFRLRLPETQQAAAGRVSA
ncbi:Histidine kinase-, DNA gyrase B-, and HSP90-like ATPase [Pseudobacteriovorax antillogorgiicola]|uniref:histidine kinase n=2 Tax=Pseudobacteriovorax antillogorgiicola TaxID=1513793 RepID=A0A1Y6BUK6_9BACT|nr:histidine kinase/DNA gyrase B/HSP90-like ATPase [Pseudobacteriovorax antillogorgiicola]SMF26289.1 Histidine kinase-, DNA gyrase B-, and HSP90-like ATPase [Pseudobacteriovorax antillogorgiicola]